MLNVEKSDTPVLSKVQLLSNETNWLQEEMSQENEALRSVPVGEMTYMDQLMLYCQSSTFTTDEHKPLTPQVTTIITELEQTAEPEPSIIELLPALPDTPPAEPDITSLPTARMNAPHAHTSQEIPQINVLDYHSATLLKRPLLAIEGAIMNFIEKKGKTPTTLYISEMHKDPIAIAHIRIKHIDYQDVYYYFTGTEIEAIKIYYEKDMPDWMSEALKGIIEPDVIYSAI